MVVVTSILAIMPRISCMTRNFKFAFSAVVITAISMANLIIITRGRVALFFVATMVVGRYHKLGWWKTIDG